MADGVNVLPVLYPLPPTHPPSPHLLIRHGLQQGGQVVLVLLEVVLQQQLPVPHLGQWVPLGGRARGGKVRGPL